jgi:DNA-binding response OmpR family regulator
VKKSAEPRPCIFVVDDKLDIAKMLTVILQMNMFRAIPFCDPLIAMEAAIAKRPDYLISDIVMPGMNGIDLAVRVQHAVPTCKILLFSGQVGASELIEQAREAGYDFELVQKPIHPAKLVAAIRSL